MLLLCIGFSGAAIGAFYGVAQIITTLKTRSTAGVSRLGWASSTTAAGLWMMYGMLERSGPQLLANTPWFGSCVLVGFFLARERALPRAVGYVLPWATLGLGFVVLTLERSALAVIGPAFGVGMTVPQMIAARRAESVEGVSAPAWVASVLSGVLWVIYGLGTKDVSVAVSSATATTLNVLVLLLLLQARRRTARGNKIGDPERRSAQVAPA